MKPQAFPSLFQDTLGTGVYHEPGMTLRDYFAAKAMAALIMERATFNEKLPITAYKMADAMMKAREQ
jgi:hypothetical protein